MMILLLISLFVFFVAFLTLFSGFGLGTLLMPVLAIIYPISLAIAITAIVHGLNNLFKLILLRKNVHWGVTFKFGMPAVIAAIPGAFLLIYLSRLSPLLSYTFFHHVAEITPVKILVGILLIIVATFEWRSIGKNIAFNSQWLPFGGLISGFLGGLSGLQGAIRAPFMLHVGLRKEEFVATSASVAVLVDITRLIIYGFSFYKALNNSLSPLFLLVIILAAFFGSALGVIGLKKVTLEWIQILVACLLYFLGGLLIVGIL